MTPAALKTEITTGPLASTLSVSWASGDDTGLVVILNDATRGETMVKPLPMLAFAKFAAGSGIRQKLKGGQSSATVGAICDTAIEMLAQLSIAFDPTDADTAAMMAALVGAGVLATNDVTAAVTRCTQPASRFEVASGKPGAVAAVGDVAAARKA